MNPISKDNDELEKRLFSGKKSLLVCMSKRIKLKHIFI